MPARGRNVRRRICQDVTTLERFDDFDERRAQLAAAGGDEQLSTRFVGQRRQKFAAHEVGLLQEPLTTLRFGRAARHAGTIGRRAVLARIETYRLEDDVRASPL